MCARFTLHLGAAVRAMECQRALLCARVPLETNALAIELHRLEVPGSRLRSKHASGFCAMRWSRVQRIADRRSTIYLFLLQLIVDQGYQCTAEWYRAGHCSACPYVLARLAMARGKRLDPSAVGGRIRGPLPGHRAVCCQSRKRLLRAGQGLPLAARASIALRHAGYGGPIPTCTYEATANPGVIRLVL